MRANENKLLSAAVLMTAGVFPAFTTPAQTTAEIPLFKTTSQLVILHVTVRNGRGEMLDALPPEAFQVREDGVLQSLRFARREDIPVSLGLLIDNSTSMGTKRSQVESAALSLVELSNPADEVFVVNFNGEAWLDQDFTSDLRKLEHGLHRIRSFGFTAIRDTVDGALWHIETKGVHDRKALILITDGDDNLSSVGMRELIARIHHTDTTVYAIGLLGEEDRRGKRSARKTLEVITRESGGRVLYAHDLAEVPKLTALIAHEIRNQYIVGYVPSAVVLDGKFRRLDVSVQGLVKALARTRPGYYAISGTVRHLPSISPAQMPLLPGTLSGSR